VDWLPIGERVILAASSSLASPWGVAVRTAPTIVQQLRFQGERGAGSDSLERFLIDCVAEYADRIGLLGEVTAPRLRWLVSLRAASPNGVDLPTGQWREVDLGVADAVRSAWADGLEVLVQEETPDDVHLLTMHRNKHGRVSKQWTLHIGLDGTSDRSETRIASPSQSVRRADGPVGGEDLLKVARTLLAGSVIGLVVGLVNSNGWVRLGGADGFVISGETLAGAAVLIGVGSLIFLSSYRNYESLRLFGPVLAIAIAATGGWIILSQGFSP
jgi:hypothetical protein